MIFRNKLLALLMLLTFSMVSLKLFALEKQTEETEQPAKKTKKDDKKSALSRFAESETGKTISEAGAKTWNTGMSILETLAKGEIEIQQAKRRKELGLDQPQIAPAAPTEKTGTKTRKPLDEESTEPQSTKEIIAAEIRKALEGAGKIGTTALEGEQKILEDIYTKKLKEMGITPATPQAQPTTPKVDPDVELWAGAFIKNPKNIKRASTVLTQEQLQMIFDQPKVKAALTDESFVKKVVDLLEKDTEARAILDKNPKFIALVLTLVEEETKEEAKAEPTDKTKPQAKEGEMEKDTREALDDITSGKRTITSAIYIYDLNQNQVKLLAEKLSSLIKKDPKNFIPQIDGLTDELKQIFNEIKDIKTAIRAYKVEQSEQEQKAQAEQQQKAQAKTQYPGAPKTKQPTKKEINREEVLKDLHENISEVLDKISSLPQAPLKLTTSLQKTTQAKNMEKYQDLIKKLQEIYNSSFQVYSQIPEGPFKNEFVEYLTAFYSSFMEQKLGTNQLIIKDGVFKNYKSITLINALQSLIAKLKDATEYNPNEPGEEFA